MNGALRRGALFFVLECGALPVEPDLAAEDAAGGREEGGSDDQCAGGGSGDGAGVGDAVVDAAKGGDDCPRVGKEGVLQGGVEAVFADVDGAVRAEGEVVEEGAEVDLRVVASAYADVNGVAADVPFSGDVGGVGVFGVVGHVLSAGYEGDGGERDYQGREEGAFHGGRFMLGLDRKSGGSVALGWGFLLGERVALEIFVGRGAIQAGRFVCRGGDIYKTCQEMYKWSEWGWRSFV